jgi:glyoxylase I family protein
MSFVNGVAIGSSAKWNDSQFCSILTPAGIVGCGVFDLATADRVGSAMALLHGEPGKEFVEPEDLLDGTVKTVSKKAVALGVTPGMTGREAVERFLAAGGSASAASKPAAGTLKVRAIHHVTLVVEDLERSAAFYRDVLGMTRGFRPDFGFPGMFFEAGNTQIHLIPHSGWHSNTAQRWEAEGPDACHFAFEVDDAAAARAILEAHNVTVLRGPSQNKAGWIQLWVRDPDGYVFELLDRSGRFLEAGRT